MTRRSVAIALATTIAVTGLAQAALANTVTPISTKDWAQNQDVPFGWKADAVPPDWMKTTIKAAAGDSNRSRGAKAATFSYKSGAASWVAYSADLPTAAAIAYASRSVPNSYKVWLRVHGHVFDWGKLRWCQFFDAPPNGCFDAEMVTLHEFGHVQGLGHTSVGQPDSIMYTTSLQKPKAGYDQRDYGACDVAAMQIRYEALTPSTPISTCLSLATQLTLATSATTVTSGSSVTFTANLRISNGVSYSRLAGDPLSGRVVILQRRVPGASSWTNYGQMAAASTAGTYRLTLAPAATYEWRASFAKPAGDGVLASTSAIVKVTVTAGECRDGYCML